MKNFLFYFNRRKRKNIVVKSLCYLPSSKKEDCLGNLYLVAELTKLKRNYDNLSELIELIKDEYYRLPERGVEISFKQALEKANEFSEREKEQENEEWLEKLNLSLFSLTPDFSIFFSKKGGLKNFLVRENELFEIGDNSEVESPENRMFSNENKIFSNMIKGKLIEGDKMIILTQELFVHFYEEALFEKLRCLKKPKELKRLFKSKKQTLKEFFGVLLFVFLKKERKKIYLNIPKNISKSLIFILILTLLLILGYYFF